jgi:hypothetical protein
MNKRKLTLLLFLLFGFMACSNEQSINKTDIYGNMTISIDAGKMI